MQHSLKAFSQLIKSAKGIVITASADAVAVATLMSGFKKIRQNFHFSRILFNKVVEFPEISFHVNFYMSFLPAMC